MKYRRMKCKFKDCPFFITVKSADLDYSLIYEGFCRIDCKKKYAFDSCPYAK